MNPHEVEINGVYRERNMLVAYLSSLYPSRISYADGPAWPIIIIQTPEGQLSWHVPQHEIEPLFPHLRADKEWKWDGHTAEEKYERLARLRERGCL